jgi:hypothetical protein
MIRKLAGLAVGLVTAIALIMVIETLGHSVVPPPAGYDMNAGSALKLPAANLMFPVLGWFLGTLAGAVAALRISRASWTGWAVAALVLLGAIVNFAMITHPLWVMAAGIVAPLLAGWLAQRWPAASPEPSA